MREPGRVEMNTGTALESRLPDDPAYWDALAGRILEDAGPLLADLYEHRDTWWGSLARRWPALAAAAAVAIAAGSIALATARTSASESPYAEVARAIGPSDELGRLFSVGQEPPHVEDLLPVVARTEANR